MEATERKEGERTAVWLCGYKTRCRWEWVSLSLSLSPRFLSSPTARERRSSHGRPPPLVALPCGARVPRRWWAKRPYGRRLSLSLSGQWPPSPAKLRELSLGAARCAGRAAMTGPGCIARGKDGRVADGPGNGSLWLVPPRQRPLLGWRPLRPFSSRPWPWRPSPSPTASVDLPAQAAATAPPNQGK